MLFSLTSPLVDCCRSCEDRICLVCLEVTCFCTWNVFNVCLGFRSYFVRMLSDTMMGAPKVHHTATSGLVPCRQIRQKKISHLLGKPQQSAVLFRGPDAIRSYDAQAPPKVTSVKPTTIFFSISGGILVWSMQHCSPRSLCMAFCSVHTPAEARSLTWTVLLFRRARATRNRHVIQRIDSSEFVCNREKGVFHLDYSLLDPE